jgi:hypothetical protein
MKLCVVQPCLSACGVQVWSTETVVDDIGEGYAGLYRWTRSNEERVLGLDRGTKEVG